MQSGDGTAGNAEPNIIYLSPDHMVDHRVLALAAGDDPEHGVWQGPLQLASFIPRRAHPHALKTHQLDPKWSLERLLDANPLVWMAEVNGILGDLRHMPRELQEIATRHVLPRWSGSPALHQSRRSGCCDRRPMSSQS